MDKQKQIDKDINVRSKMVEEMYKSFLRYKFQIAMEKFTYKGLCEHFYDLGYRKIPENAVVLTDDELNEVIDTCKVSMIVTDDDGEKYISLDDHNEYTERLGKIVRQRKARIEYLEKLLDDRCDRCIERVSKETARKFKKMLKELVADRNCNEDYDWEDVQVDGQIFVECVDEICKEITEGKV